MAYMCQSPDLINFWPNFHLKIAYIKNNYGIKQWIVSHPFLCTQTAPCSVWGFEPGLSFLYITTESASRGENHQSSKQGPYKHCAETKHTWSSLERLDHSTWMVRWKQMTKPKYSQLTINVACINKLVETGYYKWYLTSSKLAMF